MSDLDLDQLESEQRPRASLRMGFGCLLRLEAIEGVAEVGEASAFRRLMRARTRQPKKGKGKRK